MIAKFAVRANNWLGSPLRGCVKTSVALMTIAFLFRCRRVLVYGMCHDKQED